RAAQLLAWLERNPEVDLYALAYTLQVGRDAMDERLAWAVDSLDELRERLGAFTKDGQLGSGVRGQVKRNKDALAGLAADEDLPSLLATWLAKGKWDRLLSMWAKGLTLEWRTLHASPTPRRLHLPVYPFSRERYWAETKPAASIPASKAPVPGAEQLHPLLHANTSNLETQRFTSRFDGSEPFLADHEVQGRRVLPGVAYLEMAHAALLHSGAGATTELVLSQIVWSRPLAVEPGTPRAVHIDLQAEDDGRVSFEIHSDDATDTARRVHGRGVAQARPRAGAASQTLDLDALRARMQRASFTAAQCYAAFEHIGLVYGPSHRGLAEVHAGEQEVLARLSLPALPAGMTLAPGLLDSALQAAIGLVLEVDGELADKSPMLPFALRELDVLAPCRREMWVWVATASDDSAVVRKLDITLMDQAGRVCVRLNGFASRRLDAAATHDDDTLLLAPAWQPRALPSDAPIVPVARRVVLLCGFGGQLLGELSAVLADTHCEVAPVVGEDLGARYHRLARHVFLRLQALAAEKPASDVLVQVVVPLAGELAVLAGLSGLLKTARLEYPRLRTQLLCLPAEMNGVVMGDRLREEGEQAEPAALLRYRDGVREVRVARELVQTPARPIWREDGVYLITGGAGAIGLVFAGEILARAPRARVILSSRSALDEAFQARLAALGERVVHRRLDVTDAAAVSALVEGIVVEYGRLDGVLHGAGLLRDAYLANKSVAELDAVLAPKVAGVVNLDRATRDVPLELFVTFSSLAGYGGNPGQADYAAANAFMDHYVIARAERVARGEASGRSVSVNWPLWAQGAMRPDAASVELMRRTAGLVPLENEAALAAFAQAVTGDAAQVLVAAGEREKLLALFGTAGDQADEDTTEAVVPAPQAAPGAGVDLSRVVGAALLSRVSALIKVKPEDIDLDEELAGYGFDSISLTELATELNRTYELDLMPTVFFEHPTLAALTAYLVETHRETMARHLAPVSATAPAAAARRELRAAASAPSTRRARAKAPRRRDPVEADDEPIAIVGLSACMPMAEDADAFWQNLLDGRDCIGEIPAKRWDWRAVAAELAGGEGSTRVKWGAFIDSIDEFDPLFFGISPREALVMDPQQRLLMTHVWKALEDAGYASESISGSRTALFVGTGLSGYQNLFPIEERATDGYSATSAVPSVGPNRMSYFLNLHGPSEPIETACSSSLVAINRGIAVLRDGTCEMAIVGGINTIVTPDAHVSFSKAGMLSEDGRCKTFSAEANGYVRGEGVGMLVLKRLSDAQAAGDAIYAVIRGGSENHGGRASSLTAPNPQAQAALLMDAYRRSGVDPRTLSYIEAHGTGTKLGDPVEITGLKSAFANLGVESGEQPFCGLGSVKSNIGHLELAAGVAGVIKVVMQMKHATLVKSLHSEPENPYIGLSGSPFYVVRENRPWVAPVDEAGRTLPRRAGVSSFGFGGVNAHVVLEEYVAPVEQVARPGGPALVVLSARTEAALTERAAQLLAWLERNPEVDLYALAYTLQVGRDAMDE
ncbi:SDR family NAD(P)-dependent oxidoreductase, partial [Burkholderia gladioli]|uniref:SDR family NAD(P)-dependent oxidoreductase n=2 Tax=Burkholderia gladioli TaxID=28095 RepID=UPI00163E9D5E